jgi:hypothetical protein
MQVVVVSLSGSVHLLVVLIGLVVDNVEEAELVDTLGGGDNAEPVTELLLLEELLGTVFSIVSARQLPFRCMTEEDNVQVLKVATRELLVGNDLNLSLALLADLDGVTEVTGAALDLDAVVQELLERLDVEDLVVDGLRAVDDELLRHLLALLGGGAALLYTCKLYLAYCSIARARDTCEHNLVCVRAGGQQSGCTYGGRHFDTGWGGERKEMGILRLFGCLEG